MLIWAAKTQQPVYSYSFFLFLSILILSWKPSFSYLNYFAVTHSLSYFYLRQRTLDSIQSSFPAYNNESVAAWKWTEQLWTNILTSLRAGKSIWLQERRTRRWSTILNYFLYASNSLGRVDWVIGLTLSTTNDLNSAEPPRSLREWYHWRRKKLCSSDYMNTNPLRALRSSYFYLLGPWSSKLIFSSLVRNFNYLLLSLLKPTMLLTISLLKPLANPRLRLWRHLLSLLPVISLFNCPDFSFFYPSTLLSHGIAICQPSSSHFILLYSF
jgi:hypothetical protein